jgi:hypothetical protein
LRLSFVLLTAKRNEKQQQQRMTNHLTTTSRGAQQNDQPKQRDTNPYSTGKETKQQHQ